MGLPEEELRMFLRFRDGILHPEKIVPMPSSIPRSGPRSWPPPARRSTNTLAPWPTSGRGKPADDVMSGFVVPRWRRATLPRRHRRHLLPHADRRTRHGQRLAHLHVRLPRQPSRASTPDRRGPGLRRQRGRGAASVGVSGAIRRSGGSPRRTPNCPMVARSRRGTAVVVLYGAANVDARQCPAPFDVRFRP